MCFVKSSSPAVPDTIQQDPVQRHQADAEITKTSRNEDLKGYQKNVRTSAIGLSDEAVTQKKTLLGE